MSYRNIDEENRQAWLAQALGNLSHGARILDAGAGELRNKRYCNNLEYVSQDFCQYSGEVTAGEGLHNSAWDTSRIDLVSDIAAIPAPDASFDAILCSEVLEHVPDPTRALDEFARLLRVGGVAILTAPFASLVHQAPYHFCSGFSKYWYIHHLEQRGFEIVELKANGDWYDCLEQELARLGGLERARGNWSWPLAYAYYLLGRMYFRLRAPVRAEDISCFGWHCVAKKVR
jgi:ubiquinone/menaquinone biosynthesis C-methylase UbiE